MILIKPKQLQALESRFDVDSTQLPSNIQDYTEAQHQFMHCLFRDHDTKGRSYGQIAGLGFYEKPKHPFIIEPIVIDDLEEEPA